MYVLSEFRDHRMVGCALLFGKIRMRRIEQNEDIVGQRVSAQSGVVPCLCQASAQPNDSLLTDTMHGGKLHKSLRKRLWQGWRLRGARLARDVGCFEANGYAGRVRGADQGDHGVQILARDVPGVLFGEVCMIGPRLRLGDRALIGGGSEINELEVDSQLVGPARATGMACAQGVGVEGHIFRQVEA